MEPILLIDTNYLCHRAFHSMGGLAYGDIGTGAVFGVLRDIISLQDSFKTSRCVFAFDRGQGHRYKLLPTYKSTRRTRYMKESEEERAAREDFRQQVKALRKEYLPAAGFTNVFSAVGYEADDIIAAIAAMLPGNEEGIIIASDHDLWQCLRRNVWCWSPHAQRAYTIGAFHKEWGLEPDQWADVKAYAGCTTDDVPGIAGVGEKTAAKYLRGELGKHTQARAKIKAGHGVYRANLPLVTLPFPGTPVFTIKPDTVTESKWQDLADRLGMHSIRNMVPQAVPRKSKGRKRKGFFV